MPPRLVTVAIVVFWLAALGWFFQHDVWPRLRPGDRPPYVLDLAQEVTRWTAPRHWDVFYKGETIGHARTWVIANDDGTYGLTTRVNFHKFTVGLIRVQEMDSTYRVTRDGRLRELDGLVSAVVFAGGPDGTVHVHGVVRDGRFKPHWEVNAPQPIGKQTFETDEVQVADNHRMLNPMQPWNRLLALQENRTWQIELFDPLMGSLSNLLPGGLSKDTRPQLLEAGVRQGAENLTWDNKEVPCLVIEYRGEGISGKTYVRQSDGLVLRQEAARGDDRLALERIPK
jgi:hypothetical protein